MYYVYILWSTSLQQAYIGYTNDLQRRLQEHNEGKSFFTKRGMPYQLVYYEAYRAERDARDREKKLKQFKQGYRRLRERLHDSFLES